MEAVCCRYIFHQAPLALNQGTAQLLTPRAQDRRPKLNQIPLLHRHYTLCLLDIPCTLVTSCHDFTVPVSLHTICSSVRIAGANPKYGKRYGGMGLAWNRAHVHRFSRTQVVQLQSRWSQSWCLGWSYSPLHCLPGLCNERTLSNSKPKSSLPWTSGSLPVWLTPVGTAHEN